MQILTSEDPIQEFLNQDFGRFKMRHKNYTSSVDVRDIVYRNLLKDNDKETIDVIIRVIDKFSQIVQYSKSGNLVAAQNQISFCAELLPHLDELGKTLVNCFAAPAISYFYYIEKDFLRAFKTLNECMEDYDQMSEYDPAMFHSFKLTQILHLIKILFKAGKLNAAFRASGALFSYLNGFKLPAMTGSFSESLIRCVPEEIKTSIYTALFIENVSAIVQLQLSGERDAATSYLTLFDKYFNSKGENTLEKNIFSDWHSVKVSCSNINHHDYIINVTRFFESVQLANFDILKLSVLLDIFIYKQSYAATFSDRFLEKIRSIIQDDLILRDDVRRAAMDKINLH